MINFIKYLGKREMSYNKLEGSIPDSFSNLTLPNLYNLFLFHIILVPF